MPGNEHEVHCPAFLILHWLFSFLLSVCRKASSEGTQRKHKTQALMGATRLVIAFSCCALCLKKRKH